MPNIPLQLNREITDKYSVDNNTFLQVAKASPKDKIDVEIGDSKQADFLPQVKIQRWDNEVNFSARLIHDEKAPTVTTEGEKILWKGDKVEAHFYDKPDASEDGGHEFEVVLNEKPKSNQVQFSIQIKGLDFFYQPALTQKEIDEGANRPENVVGSYAVYYKNCPANYVGGKEYKVGKAFHIYRPQIIDADGNEVWGELNIDEQADILTVTVPQDFLDKAVYPVVVDPTFGYITLGASEETDASSFIEMSIANPGTVGTVTSISWGGRAASALTNVWKGAIYNATSTYGLLSPQTDSTGTISSTTKQFWTLAITSGPSITNANYGVAAYIQCNANPNYTKSAYDTGGNATYNKQLYQAFGAWPNPLSGSSGMTLKFSIYATYTASGTTFPRTASATVSRAASRSIAIARLSSFLRNPTITVSNAASRLATTVRVKGFVRAISANVSNAVARLASAVRLATFKRLFSVSVSNTVSRLATIVRVWGTPSYRLTALNRLYTAKRADSATVSTAASRHPAAVRLGTFKRADTATVSRAASRAITVSRLASFARKVTASVSNTVSRLATVVRKFTSIRKLSASVSNTVSRFATVVRKATFRRALSASVSNTVSRLATLARKSTFIRRATVSVSNYVSRLATVAYNKITGVTTFVKAVAVSVSRAASRSATVQKAQQLGRHLSATVSNSASRFATLAKTLIPAAVTWVRSASVSVSNKVSRLATTARKLTLVRRVSAVVSNSASRFVTAVRGFIYKRAVAVSVSNAVSRLATVIKARIFIRQVAASVSNAASRLATIVRRITFVRVAIAVTSTAAGRLVRISRLLLNGLADWYKDKFTKQSTSYSDNLTSQGTSYSDKLSPQSTSYIDKLTP